MNDVTTVRLSARERMARFSAAFKEERKLDGVAWEDNARAPYGQSKERPVTPEDERGFPLPSTRPYPGLRAFTAREARLFFGRQRETGELRQRLTESNVVVVLGGSGSGKSSLVMAGLLPRLNDVGRIPGRRGRWYTVSFRPGDSPCQRMVDALWSDVCLPLLSLKKGPQAFREILSDETVPGEQEQDVQNGRLRERVAAIVQQGDELTVEGVAAFLAKLDAIDARIAELRGSSRAGNINLLLLIDQFEELFRDTVMNEKQKDVRAIVELLKYARGHRDGPLVVVVTLRSEELHRCTEIDGLAPIVNSGFYLIDRPSLEALEMATINPGRQTLQHWGVNVGVYGDQNVGREGDEGRDTTPFSAEFMQKVAGWIRRFQREGSATQILMERRKRHQADLLPLFQHLLRISWGAAVERWATERPEHATVEVSDIEKWIKDRSTRVDELRKWMRKGFPEVEIRPNPGNMLEKCFDVGFAITLSEAVTGRRWNELVTWPTPDRKMQDRLRLAQAAFVALASYDDQGNDVRRPANAAEILAASNQTMDEATLRSVLSFFKSRNYLQGGEGGERYDVSHEALIRNSTEYQAWLANAQDVTDALTRASAALAASEKVVNRELEPKEATRIDPIRRALRTTFGKLVLALQEVWNAVFLGDLRAAGARFSETTSRELERVFGANAVFSSEWMAERAQLGKNKNEQKQANQNIEAAWTKAYRWHVDIGTKLEGQQPYFENRIIRIIQAVITGRHAPHGFTGRRLFLVRLALLLYCVFGVLPGTYFFVESQISPLRERATVFAGYATADGTSDFRLKLLLLASVLRHRSSWLASLFVDFKEVEEATRDVLLRSPVFVDTPVAASWDYGGQRLVTLKNRDDNFIVHDLVDGKTGKLLESFPRRESPGLPPDPLEADFTPPPSVGLIKQENDSFLVAFRSVAGAVWIGKEGTTLKSVYTVPKDVRGEDEYIARADILRNYVRVVYLKYASVGFTGMSVLDLSKTIVPGFQSAGFEAKSHKKELNWNPLSERAIRQPVLAEDCQAYAFLGRDPPRNSDENPTFNLFLQTVGAEKRDSISIRGKLLGGGAVTIARDCSAVVVRDEGSQLEKESIYEVGKIGFHIVPLQSGTPGKVSTIPVASLEDEFGAPTPPVLPQAEAIFASAPLPGGKSWRVGWPTGRGLALLDLALEGSKSFPVPGQKRKQLLTGIEGNYQAGSLRFSRNGLIALLMRQETIGSRIQLLLYDLDLEARKKSLPALTGNELLSKACQIAKFENNGELTFSEKRAWFNERAPQPCDGIQ